MLKRSTICLALSMAALSCRAQALENARDVIAAHIRTQGYACAVAKSAERQPAASRPDEQAWILTCSNATYFVRLIPDMAAQVQEMPAR